MSSSKEGRKFVRHTIPVMIEAPTLSEVPLVPEDVSTGGFGVVITKKLEPGNLVPCDIQVLDGMFKGCEAEIMWARENGTSPPTWTVGLTVRMSGEERARFEQNLQKLLLEFYGSPDFA